MSQTQCWSVYWVMHQYVSPKEKGTITKSKQVIADHLLWQLGCDAREFVPVGQTVNFTFCIEVPKCPRNDIQWKWPEKWRENWIPPLTERSFLWSTKFQTTLSHLISRTCLKWLPALPWETRLGSKVCIERRNSTESDSTSHKHIKVASRGVSTAGANVCMQKCRT